MEERLYTLKEAAGYFRVSTKSVLNWLKSGKLSGSKVGRAWRFTEAQLKAALQPSEATDTSGTEEPETPKE